MELKCFQCYLISFFLLLLTHCYTFPLFWKIRVTLGSKISHCAVLFMCAHINNTAQCVVYVCSHQYAVWMCLCVCSDVRLCESARPCGHKCACVCYHFDVNGSLLQRWVWWLESVSLMRQWEEQETCQTHAHTNTHTHADVAPCIQTHTGYGSR